MAAALKWVLLMLLLAGCEYQPPRPIHLDGRYWECTKTATAGAKPVVVRCVQWTEKQ